MQTFEVYAVQCLETRAFIYFRYEGTVDDYDTVNGYYPYRMELPITMAPQSEPKALLDILQDPLVRDRIDELCPKGWVIRSGVITFGEPDDELDQQITSTLTGDDGGNVFAEEHS